MCIQSYRYVPISIFLTPTDYSPWSEGKFFQALRPQKEMLPVAYHLTLLAAKNFAIFRRRKEDPDDYGKFVENIPRLVYRKLK